MNSITAEICPQCTSVINCPTNRLVQDMCGHKKCRVCLMQDDLNCKMCQQSTINFKNLLNVSVIKYDGTAKTSKAGSQIECDTFEKCSFGNVTSDTSSTSSHEKKPKRQYKAVVIPSHILMVSKSPATYQCTICSKSFHTTSNIKYHLFCTGGEKPLKCSECEKRFITQSHLDAHLRTHLDLKPLKCDICSTRFTQKSKLNRHMKIHTGDFKFVCPDCGKKFANKEGLTGHTLTHTGEQPFKCPECGKRFNNKSNLNKHIDRHSKTLSYVCDQCGKKFRGKWSLAVHTKTHSPEKPYSCHKCSRAFKNSQDLKRHLLTHDNISMFTCLFCTTKFRRKDNLDRHIKNNHSATAVAQKDKTKTVTPNISPTKPKSETIVTDNVNITETQIDIKEDNSDVKSDDSFIEKPNAINVIKSSESVSSQTTKVKPRNAVPVINGPFKLAFKTEKFKHNYNIHNRDYVDTTSLTKVTEDYNELLNTYQRFLSPMNAGNNGNEDKNLPRNVIMSVGKVNEKDSVEICKKILSPVVPALHYETSFENKQHASIKNIKFKLPSTYTDSASKSSLERASTSQDIYSEVPEINYAKPVTNTDYDLGGDTPQYTELQPVRLPWGDNIPNPETEHQTVIVNPSTTHEEMQTEKEEYIPPFNEMHWRKRTSQFSQKKRNTL